MGITAISGVASRPVDRVRSLASASLPYAAVVAQLLLALLVIQQFRLESRTFFNVSALTFGGFAVHALLPLRFRLAFFAALSACTVVLAFGAREGAIVLGLGGLFVGIAHLPVRFALRVALVLAGALGLALARGGVLPADWLGTGAWAILGSMLMFRLAVYMYSLHTASPDDPKPTAARTFAYFFMTPNVSFPLFPVVDYNTFTKNYYDRPAAEIYQTGALWIARGLVQLALYRVAYQAITGDVATLSSLLGVVKFVLATYLLYLRVSGTFHLIVGMLCLFGFRLPETHHLYYLASSFNDYWRRINIYWKDFMMKLVYYPSFFRLRRFGNTAALVGATSIVFLATWLLHSYQWFWLRGGHAFTVPDALFWGILGALVVWNAVSETRGARAPRTRAVAKPKWTLALALRTGGTFLTICMLWSMWSAESIGEWLTIFIPAGRASARELAIVGALVVAGLAIAGYPWGTRAVSAGSTPWYRQPWLRSIGALVAMLTLLQPAVQRLLPARAREVVSVLRTSTLNARDEALKHKGYYEKMDAPGRTSVELWDAPTARPAGVLTFFQTPAYRKRGDFQLHELTPGSRVEFFGQRHTVSAAGLRDREYTLAKAPGTYRIAVLGPSYVFGTGVADDATFEAQLEARLNRELAGRPGAPARFEVLNFGVPAYSVVQDLGRLRERALPYRPDAVLAALYPGVQYFLMDHLSRAARAGQEATDAGLRSIMARHGYDDAREGPDVPFGVVRAGLSWVGVSSRMPYPEKRMVIRAASDDVAAWSYREMARSIREAGATPVLVMADLVRGAKTGRDPSLAPVRRAAEGAGFRVLDLFDAYDGRDAAMLRVATWDDHPNAEGQRLIADRLFAELTKPGVLPGAVSAP